MTPWPAVAAGILATACLAGNAAVPRLSRPQSNYLLACGGCHGENGVSNSRLVPELYGQVGYFLNTPAGREYLVRLPNVAFADMNDQDLAEVMNFLVFTLGAGSAPANASRYSRAEVARLRRRPLNEVSLLRYRGRLIDTLIRRYGASERLRVYAGTAY